MPERSVIITVGDEILAGFVLDTNSHWLAEQLREAGYPASRIEVVGDSEPEIVAAVERAVAEPGVTRILVCGGLGPTSDDRTLAAVSLALRRPLEEHPAALAHVQGLVERMHAAGWLPSPEISAPNRRMTMAPRGGMVLPNRRGMASGLAYALDDGASGGARWLVVLPGVPRELQAIMTEEAVPLLFSTGTPVHVAEARYRYGMESDFVEPMRVLEQEYGEVAVGSYPQSETRELVIRLRGTDRARVEAALNRLLVLRPPTDGRSTEAQTGP